MVRVVGITIALIGFAMSATMSTAAAPGRTIKRLGLLSGAVSGFVVAVNNDGVAVGYNIVDRDSRAVKWDSRGRVIELYPPSGGHSPLPGGIDEQGTAFGWFEHSDNTFAAVRWEPDGRAVEVAELTSNFTTINEINRRGIAVGNSIGADGWGHAVRWDRDGRLTQLDAGSGYVSGSANAINGHGEIAGVVTPDNWNVHAVIWDRSGTMTRLPDIGQRWNVARDINDHGTVVGQVQDAAGLSNPARWDRSGTLVTLPVPVRDVSASALQINNADTILGEITLGDGVFASQAVLWDRHAHAITLDLLPGGGWSRAKALNAHDLAVGSSGTGIAGEQHAVLWDRSGRVTDLGTLPGSTQSDAADINDHGVVVGNAWMTDVGLPLPVVWR